jgi:NAD(P)-dependent dehydrogenase (short-subunit alcohol dehydrogenase family)
VATDMILPRDDARRVEFESQMSAQTLVGRLAAPEDLAAAVLFLCTDQSTFMTGRSLFMDGGLLA